MKSRQDKPGREPPQGNSGASGSGWSKGDTMSLRVESASPWPRGCHRGGSVPPGGCLAECFTRIEPRRPRAFPAVVRTVNVTRSRRAHTVMMIIHNEETPRSERGRGIPPAAGTACAFRSEWQLWVLSFKQFPRGLTFGENSPEKRVQDTQAEPQELEVMGQSH